MESVFNAIKGRLSERVVLTDVGSAKGSVIEAAQRVFGHVPEFFVPGHPIAGTEQSGVEASFSRLYQDRRVILTPLPGTSAHAAERVRDMWEATGAQVVSMNPVHHDAVLAATSHLPHLLAYSLVDTLARLDDNEEVFEYAAGGFRDFTRIASSDPVMWRDICLANGEAIVLMLEHYISNLQLLSKAIHNHDDRQLLDVFTAAKAARDRFIDRSSG
jgi:prephenate dehydrogenase